MAKKKTKAADPAETDIHLGTLIEWMNDSDEATEGARERAEKCRDYYDSKQWTDDEIKILKKRKQAATVVNRIKPKMDGLAGMERSNRTTAKAHPRTPQHAQDATAATEAVRYVLDDNFYRQTRSSAWNHLTIEGTGGCEVIVKPRDNKFDIVINHIPWDRIVYDPHSRRQDFGDARYLGQVMWLDYDIALEAFPGGKDVLDSMIHGSSTYDDKPRWMDTKRKRVKIVELYYLKDGDWHYACFTRGGYLKGTPKKSPYVTETGETEHPYEFASLHVDREGNRYGAALQYLDVQDEINKRRSKALHLMSVRQVRWERGAVEDINKAREELAKPDGVLETTPGMEFEVLKTADMAQAQFKLLEDAKLEIDAVGYSAAAAGKEERLMSGIALRNREAAAQTELAPMFDVLKHLDVRVYRKIWNCIKKYWRAEMWLRVTDDPANVRFVGLNVAQPQIDPKTGAPMPSNMIAEMDVDIIMDDAPDSITMQQEEFTALSEMVKSGIPIPPTAIIEASNLKNKDRILQEMRQGMALPPELQEQMQKQQEEFQKLQQENVALKQDMSIEAAKLQSQSQLSAQEMQQKREMEIADLEHQKQVDAAKFALEKQKMELEFNLKKEQQDREIELERTRTQADLELQGAGTILENEQANKKLEFEQERAKKEDEFKRAEQVKSEEQTAMPNFMKALEKMTQTFAKTIEQILERQQKFEQQIVKEMSKPKTVSLDSITRNDGFLTGAKATVQ